MDWKKASWLLGLFLVFAAMFYLPFTIEPQEQVVQEMAMMRATADAPPEPESPDIKTPILTAILLGLVATMLSWAVVDKVLQEKEDVVLLSFQDDSGKTVMDALSNETCRKILESLSEKEMTASQLSEDMDMSIQRVQYNLKKLEEAKLIESDSYKYSSKGREMDVYKLTRKYFVLGPK